MSQRIKYWVACSGGVDSIVLVHLFHELGKKFGILHCNFQLRGKESDEDEKFVKNLAQALSVPFKVRKFDTQSYQRENNSGVQLAARELRYAWFDQIINDEEAAVCLAHHKDDQVETFFLQLWRGGKVKGLAGMPLSRNGYCRPLMNYSKRELKDLALRKAWEWREDKSNKSNSYKRNFYRNELLPLLDEKVAENVLDLVNDFQLLLKAFRFDQLPTNRYGAFEFPLSDWEIMPIWIKKQLLDAHGLGKFPTHEIDKLMNASNGAMFKADKRVVLRAKDKLLFIREENKKKEVKFIKITPDAVDFTSGEVYIDLDKVKHPLIVRSWNSMDNFIPLGMNGRKTIAKFLKDNGVPHYYRQKIKVVVDNNELVVAVAGETVAEDFKVDNSSQSIVKCVIC